jgi:hypothetical protein
MGRTRCRASARLHAVPELAARPRAPLPRGSGRAGLWETSSLPARAACTRPPNPLPQIPARESPGDEGRGGPGSPRGAQRRATGRPLTPAGRLAGARRDRYPSGVGPRQLTGSHLGRLRAAAAPMRPPPLLSFSRRRRRRAAPSTNSGLVLGNWKCVSHCPPPSSPSVPFLAPRSAPAPVAAAGAVAAAAAAAAAATARAGSLPSAALLLVLVLLLLLPPPPPPGRAPSRPRACAGRRDARARAQGGATASGKPGPAPPTVAGQPGGAPCAVCPPPLAALGHHRAAQLQRGSLVEPSPRRVFQAKSPLSFSIYL